MATGDADETGAPLYAKIEAALAQADRLLDPCHSLNEVFRDADLVISTVGYNSVLEMVTKDTLTLLVLIPGSIEDQVARSIQWGHPMTKLRRWPLPIG